MQLIARQDLGDEDPRNYFVCETHFQKRDVNPGPPRKTLQKNSMPQLDLPPEGKMFLPCAKRNTLNSYTQTTPKYEASTGSQTDSAFEWMPLRKRKYVQGLVELHSENVTEGELLADRLTSHEDLLAGRLSPPGDPLADRFTPPGDQLAERLAPQVDPLADLLTSQGDLVPNLLTPQAHDTVLIKQEHCDRADIERFSYLCDKFLSKDLSELMKIQAILKLKNK